MIYLLVSLRRASRNHDTFRLIIIAGILAVSTLKIVILFEMVLCMGYVVSRTSLNSNWFLFLLSIWESSSLIFMDTLVYGRSFSQQA